MEHPEIFVIKADETSDRVEDRHSDVSCDPQPPMGSILYLTEIAPDGGGDTMFANMYLAYDTLSHPIRELIDGLTAIHDGEHVYRRRYGVEHREFLLGKRLPRAETGRRFLATPADSGRQRPRYPASPAAKPREVKDYSHTARKPVLRRTGWWSW
jgi:alpha-ketoglutarate-dependent taurine dioxygenase